MAARPGRDPAAQCRIFEALRKMPQGQGVRLELRLERGTKDAGLDAGGARGAVDFDDAVEMPQIERDRRPARGAVDRRLDAADDAAAGAERDQRRLRAARPIDDRGHLGLVARVGDDIGRVVVLTDEPARIVRKRLAVGVGDPVVRFARAMRRQGRRRRDPRRPQLDLGQAPAGCARRTGRRRTAGGSGRERQPPPRPSAPRLHDPSRNV